jgi:hypothetical protein
MKFFLSVIFLFAIIIVGCKPDSDAPCRASHSNVVPFTLFESSKYPFKGMGDTLRYISLSGDSIWCLGSIKNLFCNCIPVKNNPECPPDSFGYEIDEFNYADTLGKLLITAQSFHLDSSMIINANHSVFNIPLVKVGLNDSITWFDSLQFGNKMFYNLQSFVNSNGDSLYYNSAYGMIGLKSASQRFYIYRFNGN